MLGKLRERTLRERRRDVSADSVRAVATSIAWPCRGIGPTNDAKFFGQRFSHDNKDRPHAGAVAPGLHGVLRSAAVCIFARCIWPWFLRASA